MIYRRPPMPRGAHTIRSPSVGIRYQGPSAAGSGRNGRLRESRAGIPSGGQASAGHRDEARAAGDRDGSGSGECGGDGVKDCDESEAGTDTAEACSCVSFDAESSCAPTEWKEMKTMGSTKARPEGTQGFVHGSGWGSRSGSESSGSPDGSDGDSGGGDDDGAEGDRKQRRAVRRPGSHHGTDTDSDSDADTDSEYGESFPAPTFLVYGHRGWIGGKIVAQLERVSKESGLTVVLAQKRPGTDPDGDVIDEFKRVGPTHVVCAIGRTRGPGCNTIDYLEEGGPPKLAENVRDNLYGPMMLAKLCELEDELVHLTYLGTGCIFTYTDELSDGAGRPAPRKALGGRGCVESDVPNFFGSSYSVVKGFTDRLMHMSPDHVLNLRIRMPVTDEDDPRNFITKIASYAKVINVPNSVTVLDELIPIAVDMALNGLTGTMNLVNPGPLSIIRYWKSTGRSSIRRS